MAQKWPNTKFTNIDPKAPIAEGDRPALPFTPTEADSVGSAAAASAQDQSSWPAHTMRACAWGETKRVDRGRTLC